MLSRKPPNLSIGPPSSRHVPMAIDALLPRRRTIYDGFPAGVRLDAAPLIARGGIGMRLALRF